MKTIKLSTATYEYEPSQPLGKRGGFGQVFLGKTATGDEVAVKKLHVSADDAGHRELRIADDLRGKSFEHIISFIDSGEDADSGDYFVVMAKAERSLQTTIESGGPLEVSETASLVLDLVKGLLEVKDLVHRDLKPDNVLFHEGKWKIADFGIARFIEEVTAANTLKDCLSPYYAAPEQWRFERSTHATDVYALGCIAFCLLTGNPPFIKTPEIQHKTEPLPSFNCSDNRLLTLINMMVRKLPEVRPGLLRLESALTDIVTRSQAGAGHSLSELGKAGARVATKEQEREAQIQAQLSDIENRRRLARAAADIMSDNLERLWGKVHAEAPIARRKSDGTFQCLLGEAQLVVKPVEEFVDRGIFARSRWDVVAWMEISVSQHAPPYRWSASLWYMQLPNVAEHRWYEVSYFDGGTTQMNFEPFACRTIQDADLAAAPGLSTINVAFGPVLIDDEKEHDFHNRWIHLLAKAADGQLRRPSSLPIVGWPPQ